MKVYNNLKNREIIQSIQAGGVGIIPTDTVLGVIGSALSPDTVERIYNLKNRDKSKPVIVLIGSKKQIKEHFGLDVPKEVSDVWPARLSIILSCNKYPHIHRGKKSIAFRVPDRKDLVGFLQKAGPVVAPSANPEGKKPAGNIQEAKDYFGERVDFYVKGESLTSKPSTVVEYKKGDFNVIRKGAVNAKHFQ